MDILGNQGEKALQETEEMREKMEERFKKMEKHLESLENQMENDNAGEVKKIIKEEMDIDREQMARLGNLEERKADNREVSELETRTEKLENVQKSVVSKIGKILDENFIDTLGTVKEKMDRLERSNVELEEKLDSLEERLDDLENKTMVEMNKREYDFDRKLDESKFEEEKHEMMEEVKKIRASVNVLAEEVDGKDILEIDPEGEQD